MEQGELRGLLPTGRARSGLPSGGGSKAAHPWEPVNSQQGNVGHKVSASFNLGLCRSKAGPYFPSFPESCFLVGFEHGDKVC